MTDETFKKFSSKIAAAVLLGLNIDNRPCNCPLGYLTGIYLPGAFRVHQLVQEIVPGLEFTHVRRFIIAYDGTHDWANHENDPYRLLGENYRLHFRNNPKYQAGVNCALWVHKVEPEIRERFGTSTPLLGSADA